MAIPRLSRAEPPTSSAERVPFLKVLSGYQAGLIVLLEKEKLTLGRDESCDIVLDELGVSRFHCSLNQQGND